MHRFSLDYTKLVFHIKIKILFLFIKHLKLDFKMFDLDCESKEAILDG